MNECLLTSVLFCPVLLQTPSETGKPVNQDTKRPETAEQPGNINERPLSSSAEVEVDDPTGRPLASESGVQTPTSDCGIGMYTPTRSGSHSGSQTPVSPGPRTVRFPPADELATNLTGGTQPPAASGRAVRFPKGVIGPGPGEDGSASASVSAVSTSQPARGPDAPDAVGGAGLEAAVMETKMDGRAALGRDASIVSAQ